MICEECGKIDGEEVHLLPDSLRTACGSCWKEAFKDNINNHNNIDNEIKKRLEIIPGLDNKGIVRTIFGGITFETYFQKLDTSKNDIALESAIFKLKNMLLRYIEWLDGRVPNEKRWRRYQNFIRYYELKTYEE